MSTLTVSEIVMKVVSLFVCLLALPVSGRDTVTV